MNSENIFLSKQIEQVDITDPSIDQRGKTNKPSVQKPERGFCAPSSRMWGQQRNDKGEHSTDDKRVTLTEKEVSPEGERLPRHQGQTCLGTTFSYPAAHMRSLISELCWVITCNACHRLGPEWRVKLPTKPCQKLQTDYALKNKSAALNLSAKKLFLSYWSCPPLWPPSPSPRGSPKSSIQV